jgi:hypothetical protein
MALESGCYSVLKKSAQELGYRHILRRARNVTYISGMDRSELVEAAGVEPASEKARHAKTTCVSGSAFFVRPPVNRQDASGLARLISA